MKITKKDLDGLAKYLRECRDFGTFWTIKVYSAKECEAQGRGFDPACAYVEARCLMGTLWVTTDGEVYVNEGSLTGLEWAQLHEPPRGCLMSKYEFWTEGIVRWLHGDSCFPLEMKPGAVLGEGECLALAIEDAWGKLGVKPLDRVLPLNLKYESESVMVVEGGKERVRIIAWRG